MEEFEPITLECTKRVYLVKNSNKVEDKSVKLDLFYFETGQEGGDFNDLVVNISNIEEVLKKLNVGDHLEIEAVDEDGDEMFEPIIINVLEDKELEFESYYTSGSWCFHLNEDW